MVDELVDFFEEELLINFDKQNVSEAIGLETEFLITGTSYIGLEASYYKTVFDNWIKLHYR